MSRDLRIILATLAVTAITVVAGYIGLVAWLGSVAGHAKVYLDDTVPTIVTKWDADEFIKETEGKYQGPDDRATLERMFGIFGDLGSLRSYGGADGTVNVTYTPPFGFLMHGTFEAQAQFDSGPATITISIHKADGRWYIDNLQMKSQKLFSKDA